jgi:hypothetical protein
MPRRAAIYRRDAEDRHHRITDVLIDQAAVRNNDPFECDETAIDEAGDFFGIQLLGNRGETGDVSEENGRLAPLTVPALFV